MVWLFGKILHGDDFSTVELRRSTAFLVSAWQRACRMRKELQAWWVEKANGK